MIENKEEEISDLQIQMQEFKNSVFDTGKNIFDKVKKTSQENDNLVKWLNIYDKQIKENEKEIYDLNVRLYFSQQQQQHQSQNQPQHQPQHQPLTFKSLAEYFAITAATLTATTTATSTATTTATTATTAMSTACFFRPGIKPASA